MAVYKKVPGHETVNISTLEFDTKPTKGSLNPVTSGGVAEAISDQSEENKKTVRYRKIQTLYLGENIFDFAHLSYDHDVWSVDAESGKINYLGGTIDPIVMEVSTTNNSAYLLECITSDYVTQTNMFSVSIGDGYHNDPYNGSDNIAVGAISDGGYLKIYPISTTNTFTLSEISLRKKVSQSTSVETKYFEGLNVNSGNSDDTILDGKWNVAVGPTEHTQSKAVGLSRSVAIGYMAQDLMDSGLQNIAIGTFAQNLMKYAERSVAIGADCMYAVTFADDCVAIGQGSLRGNPGQVNWNTPSSWQHITQFVAIGSGAAKIANGQTATKSVYIGFSCCNDGVGTKCTAVGADIRNHNGKTNCTAIGYAARCDKNNQTVIGNSQTTETKIFGDFIVEGTDGVKRKIVFNDDHSVTWETVS